MSTSRYIARLMGPVLLIIGIGMVMGMLTEGDAYSSLLKEFIGSRALIFVTGVWRWSPEWRSSTRIMFGSRTGGWS